MEVYALWRKDTAGDEDKGQRIYRSVRGSQLQRCKTHHKHTGNMSSHVKKCWGDEAVAAVKDSTLDNARSAVKQFGKKSQTKLTAALKTFKGWAETFST